MPRKVDARAYNPRMRRPWVVLLIAWLGWVFDIMDTALFNLAKVPMLTEMLGGEAAYKAQGPAIEGRIQMWFVIGWAIGGLVFGVLADRWGRGKTMALTILLYCLFTGLTGLCTNPDQVVIIRFLTALGIGGEWAAGAALVAESFSDKHRPIAAAVLQTAAAFGPWFAAFLNYVMRDDPWQWLFYAGIAPAVIVVFIRFGVKDSVGEKSRERLPNPILTLFKRRDLIWRVVLVMLIGTVGIAGAGTASYWVPNLVKEASQGLAEADVRARTSGVTFYQHIGTLAGVFLFPWLAKRFGRRLSIGAGFLLALGLFWFGLKSTPSYEALKVLVPAFSFAAIGVTAVFGLYFPELFPSAVRATGAGFGYNTARILNAPVPYVTGLIIGTEKGSPAVGVAIASTFYILGILLLPFAPETRDEPLPA